MAPEAQSWADGRLGVDVSCPRCGSAEVRRLSLIYQLGLEQPTGGEPPVPSVLSRYAAPPERKPALEWMTLALVSISVAVASYAWSENGTAVLGSVAVLATLFAARAAHHNARVHPSLQRLWDSSYMCTRCGEIFAAAGDQS